MHSKRFNQMKKQTKQTKYLSYLLLIIVVVLGARSYFQESEEVMQFVDNSSIELEEGVDDVQVESIDEPIELTAAHIDELTQEDVVVQYLKEYGQLPDYYITKREAQEAGWVASQGNLCDVLPGRAIGGDRFGNREGRLPSKAGRQYYEADLNYNCGRRNADRVVYSNDNLIFITKDHYNSFTER